MMETKDCQVRFGEENQLKRTIPPSLALPISYLRELGMRNQLDMNHFYNFQPRVRTSSDTSNVDCAPSAMRSTLFLHCPLARELDPPKFLLIAISPLGISSPQIAPKPKLFLLSILTLNTLQHSSSSPQRAGLTRTRRAATDSTFGLSACSPGSIAPSGRVKSTVGPNALDAADKPDEVSRHSIFPSPTTRHISCG